MIKLFSLHLIPKFWVPVWPAKTTNDKTHFEFFLGQQSQDTNTWRMISDHRGRERILLPNSKGFSFNHKPNPSLLFLPVLPPFSPSPFIPSFLPFFLLFTDVYWISLSQTSHKSWESLWWMRRAPGLMEMTQTISLTDLQLQSVVKLLKERTWLSNRAQQSNMI